MTNDVTGKGASLEEALKACDWPSDRQFTFHDEPGDHDPCYVVMPDGASLPLNHHAGEGVDIARAKFIIAACNAALTPPTEPETPTWRDGRCYECGVDLVGPYCPACNPTEPPSAGREGWKLVPEEPPIEMIIAGQQSWLEANKWEAHRVYRAMLAAAPSPEPLPSEEEGERRDERPSPDTSALLAEAESLRTAVYYSRGAFSKADKERIMITLRRLAQALREARG